MYREFLFLYERAKILLLSCCRRTFFCYESYKIERRLYQNTVRSPEQVQSKNIGNKMKINFSQVTLLTLVGIQVIVLICLFALQKRTGLLESVHEEPKEQRK